MKIKAILWGLISAGLLFGFYFGLTSWVSGFDFAKEQFIDLWYWFTALTLGFGVQVGLFVFLKSSHKSAKSQALSASGGSSAIAMIACCAHRLVDVFPIFGITLLSSFLIKYQIYFFAVGLAANIFGIFYLINKFKKIPS